MWTDGQIDMTKPLFAILRSAYKIKVTVIQNIIISKMLNAALWIVSRTNADCISESLGLCLALHCCEHDLLRVAA
jgi:hypothetical protein